MPHLHLSLQAMDDLILKRMKRRHSRAEALAIAARARAARPDVVFGADLIAGFTESEAMFLNTLNAVEEMGLTYLHVFPYSPRPNTPAARMPQVPGPRAANGLLAARGGCSGAPVCLPRRHTDGGAGGRQRCRPVPVVRAGFSRRVRRWRGGTGHAGTGSHQCRRQGAALRGDGVVTEDAPTKRPEASAAGFTDC